MTEETLNGSLEPYTPPSLYPGWHMPEAHTLPSGAIFWLRKPQIRRLIQRGQIPNPLMEVIDTIFERRDTTELTAEAKLKGMTEQELLEQRSLEQADETQKAPPPPNVDEMIEDALKPSTALEFRDVVVWAAIVAPTVEMEPPVGGTPMTASGALAYDAIDEQDQMYILRFVNGELEPIATFPADAERPSVGGDSGAVEHQAEPVVGHPA